MDDVERLALAFRYELKRNLLLTQFEEMRRRNALPEYSVNACASHDFCDANVIMDDAFLTEFGREADLQSDADIGLMNRAWDAAKLKYLTAWECFEG